MPPKALKHFSKDMEIARTIEEGTADQELTLEIGILVKGAVLDPAPYNSGPRREAETGGCPCEAAKGDREGEGKKGEG